MALVAQLRGLPRLRRLTVHTQVAFAAQFLDGPLGHVRRQRLPVPAILVLDLAEALAFDGAGQDHGRLAAGLAGVAQGAIDLGQVMAVDQHRVAAERLDARRVDVHMPAVLGFAPLTQAVHVHDRRQVGEPVLARLVEGFPNRALGELRVAAEHPHVVRQLVQVLARQRHPDPDRQALSQRAGGHVDPGQRRRRVALEAGAELAEAHQLVVADGADGLEHGVAERRGMALAVDQVVIVGLVRPRPVVLQVAADQDGNQVGRRHRRGRMARTGGRAAADRVDAQLLAEVAQEVEVFLGGGFCYCHLRLHFTPLRLGPAPALGRGGPGGRRPRGKRGGPPPEA